jgi:predicted RNA binding protein YcfA (HicA-like mRNA interferase family)
MKVRDMLKLLRKDGWLFVRQKGGHRQFQHPSKTGTVTVAGKPSLDLDLKTQKSILRQAQILEDDDEDDAQEIAEET